MRVVRVVLPVAAAFVVLVAGFALGVRSVGIGDEPATVEPTTALYEAQPGVLQRVIEGEANLSWPVVANLDVPVEGRLTALPPADGPVSAGDVVVEVDGRATVAVEGATPAYRLLEEGQSGADVRQLQKHLATLGYDPGAEGRFDAATGDAVEAWRDDMGWPGGRIVELGRVLFVASLPAHVVAAEGTRLGAVLPSPALSVLDPVPDVDVALLPQLATDVPEGAEVEIELGGQARATTVTGPPRDRGDGSAGLPVDQQPLECSGSSDCPRPSSTPVTAPATVVLVPETTGIVVPVSAVATGADGTPTVTTRAGDRVEVELGPSADGLVIVESGLEAGTVIRMVDE